MTGQPGTPDTIPKLVRDSLRRDGVYDFGLGVVLRAPKDPKGTGGSATYRVEWRAAPVIPGRPLAKRRYRYARKLDVAFTQATEVFEEMQQRASGNYVEYHTDVLFGEIVTRWLDSPHPRWGAQYPQKVRSLLRTWVLADRITVVWRSGQRPAPLAALPIGGLTADHFNQALEHVRSERAHRTYTEVHGLIVQILKWALSNRYLPPSDGNILNQLPLAPSDSGHGSVGGTRAVPAEEIPPPEALQQLRATAERLFGRRLVTMLDLLAYAGPRISECLAFRNDDRFHLGPDGCWRIEIREQVHKTQRRTLPPKWRKHRWAFVPHWLTDDLTALLEATPVDELLFGSPGRRVRGPDGRIERVGAGLYPYSNWNGRVWTKIAEATPDWPERRDWWPPDQGPPPPGRQSERRWQWPVHALRHACATYLLNDLGLDPDDVAKFLGHRSGVQVWEMYVRVRPNLFGRAATASASAGDPRLDSRR